MTTTIERAEATLTSAGQMFEIAEEDVLGERMNVFVNRPRSLRDLLTRSREFGDREFLVFDDGRRFTFDDHWSLVCSTAHVLRERFEVGKGDRVAICAANCPEWVVTFWAAISLGALPVGFNSWWVGQELRFALEDCRPKVLVADRKRLARLGADGPSCHVVSIEDEFESIWRAFPDAPMSETAIDEDDPAAILYTSGTTGRPKGAVNSHRNVLALFMVQTFHGARAALANHFSTGDPLPDPSERPSPVGLVSTPLFHVSGLYAGVVTRLAIGSKTVWTTGRFDPLNALRLIETEGVTGWGPTATMLYRVIQHPERPNFDLSRITFIGLGGSPSSPTLLAAAREAFTNPQFVLGVGYGLTEGTALATLTFGEELEAKPANVGRPLPTIQVEIRDGLGARCADGTDGDIHIRGPLVMLGYWERPEATAAAIGPGRWLRTGDVGRIQNGRLYIASRKRDLIIRGGENIYPAEIELCLEGHPAVQEAAVIGVDHEELGQEVKAIVVLRADCGSLVSPQTLGVWVGERLAYFKVPSHWELRPEALPRNASGKVMKHLLESGRSSQIVD